MLSPLSSPNARIRLLPLLAAALSFCGSSPLLALPAFPGAEGYGANATGGRGGDVYHVTNLNASGAGSFVEGIATVPSAGRTIVFDVSGYIRFPSGSGGTRMTASKVTIAGQTAPGDGVGFYNNMFRISGDDIIVRHLRFRHGKYGSGGDCINLDSGTLNAILDHISMQFSTDENMSSFGSPPENLTLQYSLNSWGLESHSCGGLWDQNHATSHHNLWSHNHTRNPKARPAGLLEWINNVTFDWDIGFIMGDSQSVQSWKANVINNYFICPPGNTHSKALVKGTLASNNLPNFTVYLSGNLSDYDGDGLLNGTDKGYSIVEGSVYSASESPAPVPGDFRYYQSASAIAGSTVGVATDTPLLAYKKVVSNAGALRLDASSTGGIRDEVDTILLNKLTTQTAFHVTRESDTGASASGFGTLASTAAPVDTDQDGMPDFYETALGWNAAVQDHNTALASSGGFITGTTFFPASTVAGYTRLEEYLHFMAIPHGTVAKNVSGTPTSIAVNLAKFASGFPSSPTFTVSNLTGGTVILSGTGNSIATFTPTLNYVGRARFDFTVTDSAGSSWTQTCALVVTNSGLPRDLVWMGDGSANVWDSAASNWLRNGAATVFSFGDRVTFDATGSLTPAVNVTGTLSPTTVDVNATGNYTFGGTGAVTATGTLTKRGTGTLTISNTGTNSFSAATLDAGTITLGNTTAQASGLGTGAVTLNSGVLNLHDAGTGLPGAGNFPSPLVIAGTVNVNGSPRGSTTGALSGAGTLNLYVPFSRLDWGGDPALFTGTLNVTTDADGCEFRINSYGSGNVTSYGAARLWLADKVNAYFLPNPPSGGDKTQTVEVGELATTGTGTGVYLGGASGAADRIVHWKVGALNTSTTFGGVIANRTGPAALTKLGTGTLTLTGASTATGATTVSAGALLVSGSLGNTAVTVASGALLGGSGTLGGAVTASAGAILSPGTAPFTGTTLTVGSGLALNGNTLYFDMSGSPAGANDKIVLSGGTLAMSGTQYFQFLLLDGSLNAGTYNLITGATNSTASSVALTHNLPSGTRQTFTVNRSAAGSNPSLVWLDVVGDPATLTWTGTTSANWDTTANNFTGATPNTFGSNDAVVFDDSSAVTSILLPAPVTPRSTLVNNTTKAFTIAGGINGGSLTKSGTNTLTLTGANTFGGGLTLNAGTIVLANDTANNAGLGTGLVTMNGGVISMHDDSASYNNFTANLVVPSGATALLNADSRVDMYGTLSGAGTLNFYIPFIRTTLFGDWSAFTGTINVLTDASGGDFRMGTSYNFPGFPQAAIALTDKVWAYYVGTLAAGAGTTIEIGEISGTALSVLEGGATGGRALTYRIGGRNTDAVFAGTIQEQNTGTATSYIKTGAGIWTLSGSGAWNGGTTVEQGTLKITGAFACASATNVQTGATLQFVGGSLSTDAVNIASGAFFSGNGTVTGDLNNDGTVTALTGGTLAVTGDVVNNGLMRIAGGTALSATGGFVNNGTLDLLTGVQGLPPNLENNGVVIDSSSLHALQATKAGNTVTVTVQTYAGHVYQLQRGDSLTTPNWADISGQAFTGNGTAHAFTDTAATGAQRFYRVVVTP